jgi:hypothetical protein
MTTQTAHRNLPWAAASTVTTLLLSAAITSPVFADPAIASTSECQTVSLGNSKGEQIDIGQLQLTDVNGNQQVFKADFTFANQDFGDYFLSMRPFRCLASDEAMQCYLPYPYENHHKVSDSDLTDLEYQLLFIRKHPSEFGINPWHSLYYQLGWQNGPGSTLTGEVREVNLDILASPPEDGNLRPLGPDDLYETDPDKQWLPHLSTRQGCKRSK